MRSPTIILLPPGTPGRGSFLVALFVVATVLSMGCATSRPKAAVAPVLPPDVARVSVMTYNVNFGLAGDARTVAAVAQQDADVIFLQETTPAWEAALREPLRATHPHVRFRDGRGAGGLGVASKYPIESIDELRAQDWFPAMRVVLATPIGRLQVLNVHLRPPVSDSGSVVSGYFSTPPVRRAEIEAFATSLDPVLATLIVGDFNEDERGRAVRWLRNNGYRSALGDASPTTNTWRWRTSVITLRGRYDHLMYDEKLRPLQVEAREVGRSDHIPVVGVFALAPSGAGESNGATAATTQRSMPQ